MKRYTIKVCDKIKSKSADDDKKGDIIFSEIENIVGNGGGEIILDFENIEILNTAFLNNAIGSAYSLGEWSKINLSIKITNFTEESLDLIREVIRSAKEKFRNINKECNNQNN